MESQTRKGRNIWERHVVFQNRKRKAHSTTIISKINIKAEHVSGAVGQVSGSASVQADQTQVIALIDTDAAKRLVTQIRRHIDELDLPEETLYAVTAELDIIDGQLALGHPNQSRLQAAFTRMKEIFVPIAENTAGNVVAVGILMAIRQLLVECPKC